MTSPPDQRDNTNIIRTNGSVAAPAAVALYPCTCIKFRGRKKNMPESPVYRNSVNRFAPLKSLD